MFRNLFHRKTTNPNESFIVNRRKRPFDHLIVFLCLINITLIGVNIGVWFIAEHQKLFIAADFTNSFTGFKMVLDGDGTKLYDLAYQARLQQVIMGDLSFEGGLLPYLSPPIIGLLFSPLAKFSLSTAFYLWTIGEIVLLFWIIVLLNRLFSDWRKQERIIMYICLLAFWPLINTFLLGQFSLLFLLCYLQMYNAIRTSKLTKAGLWMGLLIIKPQTLLFPGVMTINKQYWRVGITAAICCIAMILFSSIFLGVGIWSKYMQLLPTVSNYFGKFGFYPNLQYTIRGILTIILGYPQANLVNLISIIILIGGLVLIWLLWLHGGPTESSRFKLYFALTVLLSAFLNMHSYSHDDLVLVLSASLFYDYLRENDYPKKAYSIFILMSPMIFFIAAFSSFNFFGVIRPPVILIIILLIWMLKYLVLEHRNQGKLEIPNRQQVNLL